MHMGNIENEGLTRPEPTAFAKWHGRKFAFWLAGILLIAGALAVGSSGDVLSWGAQHLFSAPLILLALAALYLLPGLAVLRLLWTPARPCSLAIVLALALGISVALPPLLLLLFQQLHLPWNGAVTWSYLLVSLLIAIVPIPSRMDSIKLPRFWQSITIQTSDWLLLGISSAALLVRLYIVRDLPTGLFGDPYHHTMITQLLVDNQGLFQSWQPYAPIVSFTYHFGFHSNAAFFHWISGSNVIHSVIWTGQVLNALALPMAFLLARVLTGSATTGLWSALITGFISTIPAYYVNWGRYTQLTGHTVLVIVVVCWLLLLDETTPLNPHNERSASSRFPWKIILLTALATAAMMLTHYLVTILAALFVGSYALVWVLVRRSWRLVVAQTPMVLLTLALTLLLATPWLLNLLNGYLIRNATAIVSDMAPATVMAQYTALPAIVPMFAKNYVIYAALLALGIAGWQRNWRVALAGLWSVLLFVVVIPYVIGLPGSGIVDNLTAFGALYLTLPLLAGFTLANMQAVLPTLLRWLPYPHRITQAGVGILALAIIAWGTSWQMRVIDGSTQFVTHADMQAMEWIRDHTPPDARFLVNSFPAYGGTVVAGNDAGWWIPLLTGRLSTLPPILYANEFTDPPDYWYQLTDLVEGLRGRPLTDSTPIQVNVTTPQALQTLQQAGVDYVYHGAQAVPGPGQADIIDTTHLHASEAFQLVYAQGGVEIFALKKRGTALNGVHPAASFACKRAGNARRGVSAHSNRVARELCSLATPAGCPPPRRGSPLVSRETGEA